MSTEAFADRSADDTRSVVLDVLNITAEYSGRTVLHDISFRIAEGEILAIVGPNGAGKSTLLKVLAGLLPPVAGQVIYRGANITLVPAYRRAERGIAMVMQGGMVFPSLTLEEHLDLGRRAAAKGGRTRPGRQDNGFILPRLADSRGTRAGILSGGERQALAVATAFAARPNLLLCDEPSAGLAPIAAAHLVQTLVVACREQALPVICVEQRGSSILKVADRAILLKAGRLIAVTNEPRSWTDPEAFIAMLRRPA